MATTTAERQLSAPDRRVAVGIFLLVFISYGYFFGGGGWNQNSHFDLTRAIVEDHSIRIDRFAGNTGDVVRRDAHVFANKPSGLSLFGAIPYALLRIFEGTAVDGSPAVLATNAWLVTALVCGGSGALTAVIIFLWGVRQGVARTWSFTVAMVVAFGTPVFAYSTLFFLHVPSGALMLLAFYLARRGRSRTDAAAGFAVALAVLTNYLCVPALIAVPLSNGRRGLVRARLLPFTLGALSPLLIMGWYQQAAFGAILRLPNTMNERFTTSGAFLGVLKPPDIDAILGITVSPYRGMFYLSPILAFAIAGAVIMIRKRMLAELAATASVVTFFFLVNISFNNWEGGFGIGARYLVPVLPLMGLWMLQASRLYRPLFVVLAILSMANNFVAAAVDPQPSGSIDRPLERYLYPLFLTGSFPSDTALHSPWLPQLFTGHTSVNRHSVDELVPFEFHSPGSPESEWASFNAGEALSGLGSPWSVAPIVLVLLGGSFLLYLRTLKIDAEIGKEE